MTEDDFEEDLVLDYASLPPARTYRAKGRIVRIGESMPEYKMPPVSVGQVVLWFPYGDKEQGKFAALVTAVGPETVCVAVHDPQMRDHLIRDGVRHASDPRCKEAERNECGLWSYTDHDLAQMELAAELRSFKQEFIRFKMTQK